MSDPRTLTERLKAAAAGRWREVARAVGIGDEYLTSQHGPCPRRECGGTDRFRVFDDFDATGGVYCNQCGQHLGDGFATVQWFTGCTFPESVKRVADIIGFQPSGNGHAANGTRKPASLTRHSEQFSRDRIAEVVRLQDRRNGRRCGCGWRVFNDIPGLQCNRVRRVCRRRHEDGYGLVSFGWPRLAGDRETTATKNTLHRERRRGHHRRTRPIPHVPHGRQM